MIVEPSTFQVALAVGSAGAFVDVSNYVLFDEGDFTYMWGRQSQFRDTRPGEFSFTLNNSDGRFSPEVSTLATPIFEGMRASWKLNDRLVSGRISSITPLFADLTNAETSRVRVTVEDELGAAARTRLRGLTESMALGLDATEFFAFDDPVGTANAADRLNAADPLIPSAEVSLTFGEDARSEFSGDQCRVVNTSGVSGSLRLASRSTSAGGQLGGIGVDAVGMFITPHNSTSQFLANAVVGLALFVQIGVASGNLRFVGSLFDPIVDVPYVEDQTYYISAEFDGAEFNFYVDGVLVGSADPFNGDLGETGVDAFVGGNTDVTVSELSITSERVLVEATAPCSFAERLPALQQTSDIAFDTLPAGLSENVLGVQNTDRQSLLDAVNELVKAEQGYVHAATSGTLTSPSNKIVIRERDRPETVTASFTTTTDISGQPSLGRRLTDTLTQVLVTYSDGSVVAKDSTLEGRIGQIAGAEDVLLSQAAPAEGWGSDRIVRGNPAGIDVVSFTVDARFTDTDRWADILALVPGDRIEVAGFPATQLGFESKNAWLIGVRETHTSARNLFTFYLQPVIEGLGKYGTARYAADGALTLSAGINSSVTSMSVATSGPTFTTTDLPQTIIVGSEQMTVTAVSGATPQVFTVTRGVNGSSAASHSSGAQVEIMPTFEYGF